MNITCNQSSATLWLLALSILSTGCASQSRAAREIDLTPVDVTAYTIVSGRDGSAVTWEELQSRLLQADIVVVGEQHDDAIGHKWERAIFTTVAERYGSDAALSLEMLERPEQWLVDDYLADLIDRDRFIEATASTRWRRLAGQYFDREIKRNEFEEKIMDPGWYDWEQFYQPLIDVAKEHGSKVIAANAPWARYTSLISIEDGYSKINSLTPAQRHLVSAPDAVPEKGSSYRARFWEFMAGRAEGEPVEERPAMEAGDPHGGSFTDEMVLSGFMKQFLYDATMGASIACAFNDGTASHIVHFVGGFHSDFEGGTVLELKRHAPQANVLTIALVQSASAELREDDKNRSDYVIYTGSE